MSMLSSNAYRSGPPTGAGVGRLVATPIDSLLDALEAPLAALDSALRQRDAEALERQVGALQAALAAALPRLRQPLRSDDLHGARSRVAAANARLAAQRECVARESAMFERGLALLMPAPQPAAVYGTQGLAERPATRGLYA
ncbi:MAG: hypothetical protein ABIQ29_04110 [Burkholderiaceae bacterium]